MRARKEKETCERRDRQRSEETDSEARQGLTREFAVAFGGEARKEKETCERRDKTAKRDRD